MHYSWLIALPTVGLILMSTDAHSTDTGLEYSTPQIVFTRSALSSYSAKSAPRSPFTLHSMQFATHAALPFTFRAVRWSYIDLISLPEPLTLPQSVLEVALAF